MNIKNPDNPWWLSGFFYLCKTYCNISDLHEEICLGTIRVAPATHFLL